MELIQFVMQLQVNYNASEYNFPLQSQGTGTNSILKVQPGSKLNQNNFTY